MALTPLPITDMRMLVMTSPMKKPNMKTYTFRLGWSTVSVEKRSVETWMMSPIAPIIAPDTIETSSKVLATKSSAMMASQPRFWNRVKTCFPALM